LVATRKGAALKLPRLKEERELHGWSQKKLAEESGVSRDSISNYETGQRDAWPATAKKLADALGIEIADLREPAREPAVPLVEALRRAGHVADEDLDRWLEEHGARRILMTDDEMLQGFEQMASASDRQDIPSRFEKEALEAIEEERQVLEDLQIEWARGGALIPKSGEAGSRMREKARLGQEMRFFYRRYLTSLDRFGEALYLEGRADDFVMIVGRPQIAEARKAALQALREEAFKNSRGA
jgi:transcriptional regulator with XRE-family HTH domain